MRIASPAVLAAAVVLFPAVAAAQPEPYPGRGILSTVSVGGAVTASSLQAPGGTGASATAGYLFGIFVTPNPNAVTWQVEGLFHHRGAKLGTDRVRMNYIEVPVLLRLNMRSDRPTRLHVVAGPSIGLKLSAAYTAGREEIDLSTYGSRYAIAAVAGVGVDAGRIGVELRLHHDLNATGYDFGNTSSRSRVLAMLFTVKVD